MKRRGRKRRKKDTPARPDEFYRKGPLSIARFGKDVIFKSNWDPDDFAKMQAQVAGQFDTIVRQLNETVDQIASLIARLPALKLLHRAWWESAAQHITIETEAEIGPDEALALRMIDYVQSMIASVPAAAEQSEDLSDDDWGQLVASVQGLFDKLNGEYQISSTLHRKLTGNDYDADTEEFRYRAQIYWTNVRGQRHYTHQVVALRDLLENQGDCLKAVFGIDAGQLVIEFEKIWHSLIFGLGEAFEEFESIRKETLAALESDITQGKISDVPEKILASTMDEHGITERASQAAARFLGYDLFDLQKITALPVNVLDALSWGQGQEIDFMAPGPMRGWPLKIWPIFRRPFIKIGDRYYCFDLHSLFDHIYRALEKSVFEHSEELKQKWIAQRKLNSESLPERYLRALLPGATDYGEVFYPRGNRKKDGWAELDRFFIYDDHVFIMEVKGGSFTYTSPADDFPAHVASMKDLVESPAKQARRFLEYLNSSDEVPIYDKSHQEIARLRAGDYRHITICAVSVDPFTEFAAQAAQLTKLGLKELDRPVWAISIDDLRVFADVFDTPIEFLHFVEQRQIAFESELLRLDDELDHVGLYLAHNNYSQHAADLVGEDDTRFSVFGYRSDLDRFYKAKLADPEAANPLSQAMPHRMKELIFHLSGLDRPGRVRFGCALLDLGGDARSMIFDGIDAQIARMRGGNKPQALTVFGDIRITALPWGPPAFPAEHDKAVGLARAVIAAQGEPDRWLLEPVYFESEKLVNVEWQQISNVLFSSDEVARLQRQGIVLRERRVNAVAGSVGRNDPCPCGSGKKSKKCCLR